MIRDIPFMVKDRIDWSRGLNKTLFWLVQYWLCTWTKTECHTFAYFPCNLCLELLSSFCLWWGRCKDCCCCRNIFFHVTRRQKVASEDRDQIVFKTRRSLFFGCTQYLRDAVICQRCGALPETDDPRSASITTEKEHTTHMEASVYFLSQSQRK